MDEVKKELSKTLIILISYINAVLELVPTWLSMLKSTRVLTVIGTLALMYITWKYGGLTGDQLNVVSGIEGILGVSFMGFKTLRPSQISSVATTAVETASATTTTTTKEPTITPQPNQGAGDVGPFSSPLDVEAYAASLKGTAIVIFQTFKALINDYLILRIVPSIRIDIAKQIVSKSLELAENAWKDLFTDCAKQGIGVPTYDDLSTRVARLKYEAKCMAATPGCQYLSDAQDALLTEFQYLYAAGKILDQLTGKTIKWYSAQGWPNIDSISLLIKQGFDAVGA